MPAILLVATLLSAMSSPDFATPDSTLRKFVGHVNNHEFREAQQCTWGSVPFTDKQMSDLDRLFPSAIQIKKVSPRIDGAKATLEVELRDSESGRTDKGTFTLERRKANWKFVIPEAKRGMSNGDMLIGLYGNRQPDYLFPVVPPAKSGALGIASRSQIKQIAAGILLYEEENSGFPKSAMDAMPYLKNIDLFTAPQARRAQESVKQYVARTRAKEVSYFLNPNIVGKKLSQVSDPELTVMLYEGTGGKVIGRHDGKGAIAFCDGQARLVTPMEATKLKWKLK